MRALSQNLATLLACCSTALAVPAFAERAPITYAARAAPAGNAAEAAPAIEESALGYSDMRQPDPSGPVIDVRRAPPESRAQTAPLEITREPAPVTQVRSPAPAERPAWLEQERVGPPYQANGRWYVPTPEPGYEATGLASWYGPQFHAQATSSGEPFDQEGITAAHPTLPIPSLVQVTNLENGREIIVRVNDRGPYVAERVIDLSRGAARVLGFEQTGTARVHVRYLGPAPRLVSADGRSLAAAQPAPQLPSGPTVLTPPPIAQNTPPPHPAAIEGGFVVQVGAYADLANAQRIRAAVQSAGPANVDERQTARGTLYRVRVGPFASAAEAEAARAQVAQLGYGESVVAAR